MMRLLLVRLLTAVFESWQPIIISLLPVYFFVEKSLWIHILFGYLGFEVCFLGFSSWRKRSLQPFQFPREEQKLSNEERVKLFEKCLNSGFDKGDTKARRQLVSDWFDQLSLEKIGREDILEWLSWGFYGHRVADLNDEDKMQVMKFRTRVIELCDAEDVLQPGSTSAAAGAGLFLNFMPVHMSHRPFILYFIVRYISQSVLAPLILKMYGFRSFKEGDVPYHVFNAKDPDTAKSPLIFFHGIGIGLAPYVLFIKHLMQLAEEKNRPIVLVEMHIVSQHIFPYKIVPRAFCDTIAKILKNLGHSKGTLMGHSFGTLVIAWMVKYRKEFIENLVFIDPVSIYIHHPKTLKDIFFSKYEDIPMHDIREKIFFYVLRGEPFIQRSFKRDFYWWNFIVFPEDIYEANPEIKTKIFLSEHDRMVPNDKITKHISMMGAGKENFTLHEFESCEHGAFIAMPSKIGELCSGLHELLS